MSRDILLVEILEDIKLGYNNKGHYIKGEKYLVFDIEGENYQDIIESDFLPKKSCDVISCWIRTDMAKRDIELLFKKWRIVFDKKGQEEVSLGITHSMATVLKYFNEIEQKW